MSLLESYKLKSKSSEWKAEAEFGAKLFDFTETFSDMYKFEDAFKNFSAFIKMPALEQEQYLKNNPEIKEEGVNLLRARLFQNHNGKISISKKGEAYNRLTKQHFSENDKWFLSLSLILDSYFSLNKNYIFAQSVHLMSIWQKAGYTVSKIYNALSYLFSIANKASMTQILMSEFVIMLSCLHDPAFLKSYQNSSEFEKNELHEYIVYNYNNDKGDCFVSTRFKNKKIDKDSMIDNAKILYFAHFLLSYRTMSMEEFFDIFAQEYRRFFKLNIRKVSSFLLKYEDVFRICYVNLFLDLDELIASYEGKNNILTDSDDDDDEPKDESSELDYTSFYSMYNHAQKNARHQLKVKENANYHCALESENGCKYFSGSDKKPYLEVHLLIPRQFANEFSVSLEQQDNYVCLCPSCHKLLHNACDEEKLKNLLVILKSRYDKLAVNGLMPSKELLLSAYGISLDVAASTEFSVPLLKAGTTKISRHK